MFLLDTHIAVWLVKDRARLSADEFAIIVDPEIRIAVSAVSIWEIRIKWHNFFASGDRKGPMGPDEMLAGLQKLGLTVLPLEAEHCAAALRHPVAHRDPFDDLLLTVAQKLNYRLLTRDRKLRGHPLSYQTG